MSGLDALTTRTCVNAVPVFKVAYDLESEYTWGPRTFHVRLGLHETNSHPDYRRDLMKLIGTVRNQSWGGGLEHEFPPSGVVKHFSELAGRPLVGARWTETWGIEYDGPPPPPPVERWPGTWYAPSLVGEGGDS